MIYLHACGYLMQNGNITLTVWKPLSFLPLTESMLLFHLEGDVLVSLSLKTSWNICDHYPLTWTDISSLLGVSRMTIYRCCQEFGMVDDPHGTLNDDQLRTVMTQLRREQAYYAETMVMGQLRAMGYCVSRERVRESIRSTDPINTALRWGGEITARSYSLPSPTLLWHIGKSQTYASSSLSLWHRCVTQLYCCW